MPRLNPKINPPFPSVISPKALLEMERREMKPFVHAEIKRDTKEVWNRHAFIDLHTVQYLTGVSQSQVVRKWSDRGQLPIARKLGAVRLFEVGAVEHIIATGEFPRDGDWCEEAWFAHAFFAWVPRDGLKNAPGGPADKISKKSFMPGLYDVVNERLAEVEKLRRADMAAKAKDKSA